MTAVIEPSQLHRCMGDRHILHRDFSLRSGWAGWEVATNDSSILFGPIIPKCASKMIRGLFGARNRPAGLRPIAMGSTPANATRNLSFHFAIVRPPFEHFVAGFAEVGAITIGFTKTAFRNALKSAPGLNWYRSPIQRLIEGAYCNASEHQRLGHFREYVLHFIRARHKDVHTVRQIDWLRDFSVLRGASRVNVSERLDAILRLDDLPAGWAEAERRTARAGATAAHDWLARARPSIDPRRASPRLIVDDATLYDHSQPLLCSHFEGVSPLAIRRLKSILEHHAWRYLRELEAPLLRELCEYLRDDFECLGYPTPRFCRAP